MQGQKITHGKANRHQSQQIKNECKRIRIW